ncbi:hypothetical protein [Streptosporangium amethystogenes]|uniref:hypothetical protein n=1 Tax=Streptosporangium amethystogenes TaxID=2002 RepID=UPI003CCBDA90
MAVVQKSLPADRFLVFEGWEPLCRFLGVDTLSLFEHGRRLCGPSSASRRETSTIERVIRTAKAPGQSLSSTIECPRSC